jgi:hypothetical protein
MKTLPSLIHEEWAYTLSDPDAYLSSKRKIDLKILKPTSYQVTWGSGCARPYAVSQGITL